MELGIGARSKKTRMMELPDGSKSFKTGLAIDTILACDRHPDRHVATANTVLTHCVVQVTRSSADADNGLDAFSSQSGSTNIVPFHMLHIVSYCAIVTLSLRRAVFTIFDFIKCRDLEMGVKGHSMSLRVVSFDRLCMVSY